MITGMAAPPLMPDRFLIFFNIGPIRQFTDQPVDYSTFTRSPAYKANTPKKGSSKLEKEA